ncbi:17.4 kDa class III heat shock protein-like [Durio zibethinus]|uniref:17.4 kDa class III heat shock protein-like n=1 Tax=Durio zibethinus TaxID=66656 RepID=A0A6P5WXI6_DURZI|nr:17.4 kDa class III heat shock protein-like [Durio zibethinus]
MDERKQKKIPKELSLSSFLLLQQLKMIPVADRMTRLFSFPENMEKFIFPPRTRDSHENEEKGSNTLVTKSSGKRKCEDVEGRKDIRLERKPPQQPIKKFWLPENANVSATAVTAKCENGVLTVAAESFLCH